MSKNNEYIHGFTKKEQKRLIDQAEFLEPYVYSGVDLEFREKLLEVGCGVGAQTKILCRRFPRIQIHGLDFSEAQLQAAQKYLKNEIKSKQVRLSQKDAQKLKLQDAGTYDSAFLCWILEHTPNPLAVLKSVHKQLASGAKIYCTEVFNHSLFLEPYSPAYMKYWFEFNDYQWSIKGHPFVGGQLGHLLEQAGFHDIQLECRTFHFDSREPGKRAAFLDYFFDILLSAESTLLNEGRVNEALIKRMKKEHETVKKADDGVFFYAFIRATARKK